MNLSKLGNMFTETSFGENEGEIKAESSTFDIDSVIGKFSAFNSISVIEPVDDIAADNIKADAFNSIGQDVSYEGKNSNEFVSYELASVAEPSEQRDIEAEVFNEIDKICKSNHPLIVYKSSRRRSACYTESNQNHELGKPSRIRTIANKNSGLDLSSLHILRRSRSSFSKPARSSVWGGNILPDFKANDSLERNLGNEKKLKKTKGGKGKRNVMKDQKGQQSIGKKCTPTGHISLKIKIGNKGCSMVNATENFSVTRKPEVFETKENKLVEKVSADMVSASALRTHLDIRDAFDSLSSSEFHQIIRQVEGDNLGASTENHCSDVGTSPDSEVINPVPDAPFCEKVLPDIQDGPTNSMPCVSPSDTPSLIVSQKKVKKGKKKNKLGEVGEFSLESMLTGAEATDNTRLPTCEFSGLSLRKTKYKKGKKKDKLCEETRDNATVPADLGDGEKVRDALVPFSNGQKSTKCSKSKGGSKDRSRILDLPSKKDKASKKKGNKKNVGFTLQVSAHDVSGVESPIAGNQTPLGLGETGAIIKDLSGSINSSRFSSGGLIEQYIPPRNAWVLCDECQKWRRIPAILADQIEETNCGWTCKDNVDENFADCSIPQEKSNSEINEELEISDGSCEENACEAFLKSDQNRSKVPQQSSWSLIRSNLFMHRSRKTQTIDEVMVCHCKPPSDGKMGCGDKCLNRMLNIECVRGTCPCGELCSNQQFQRRKYAKLKWFRCGKKGYGLQALEDISEGQFLIEYVGEVLDIRAYEARQREYALDGHKHFYFMTLNGSEVIDACAKGNLGRFINHSCDPNCRTEKWMVNGEVCVGLFSLRDIKKCEEVTFDYNYVRVFGAAAKKCVCDSPNCRGYIGGDPTNSEVIVQDESDDEFSEPVMTCEDREMKEDWNDIISNSVKDREYEIANEPPANRYSIKKLISAEDSTKKDEDVTSAHVVGTMVKNRFEVESSVCNNSAANAQISDESLNEQKHFSSRLMDSSLQLDGILVKAMPSAHELANTIAALSKSLSDTVESQRKLKYATVGESHELLKSNSLAKTKRSSSSIKKGRCKPIVVNDKATPDVDKSNATLHKTKKLPELPVNSHLETVEGKLNDLLDAEGGISKRKDASRGYLKLLFLTAASGNNGHGEAIQSNRDLSMILDALLKTKSRTVLVDIINKNGLQMLHNIMKRYRKEFIKTPILRKLLKVLEYLAVREILTLEHITGGPPRTGVESFRDSILVLTEHADKQVHQIARNFRDRWIPRSLRRNCCMEMDDGRIEFQQRSSNGGMSVSYDHPTDRVGKSSEPIKSVSSTSTIETSSLDNLPSASETNGTKPRKRKSRWDNPIEDYPHSKSRAHSSGDENPEIDEDAPPGFSTPCKKSPVVPSNVILGDSQPRFLSHMPLSYGITCSALQQSGAREPGSPMGWSIAPGVPFHPFPPLPSYACTSSAAKCAEKSEHQENNVSVANGCTDFQKGGSYNLGRNYFRQQKWNHSKMAPPWVRTRNGWGNDFKDSEVNWRGELPH